MMKWHEAEMRDAVEAAAKEASEVFVEDVSTNAKEAGLKVLIPKFPF